MTREEEQNFVNRLFTNSVTEEDLAVLGPMIGLAIAAYAEMMLELLRDLPDFKAGSRAFKAAVDRAGGKPPDILDSDFLM